MINIRSLSVSILGAVLLAAPFICAQDVKPSEASVTLQRPPVIRELELLPARSYSFSPAAYPATLVIQKLDLLPVRSYSFSPAAYLVSVPSVDALDLSSYREFQFGTSLPAVAKQVNLRPSDARVIHQRPAVIQELDWRVPQSAGSTDSVDEVLFTFYNGGLFRMLVTYDHSRTDGLTDEDMVEAISAKYGTATRPAEKIVLFSSSQVYNDREKVIARWEDSQYSFNLFRSTYQPTFGMVIFAKGLDAQAQVASAEAIRLDEQERPQREIDRQKKKDADNLVEQAKARLVNKPAFLP